MVPKSFLLDTMIIDEIHADKALQEFLKSQISEGLLDLSITYATEKQITEIRNDDRKRRALNECWRDITGEPIPTIVFCLDITEFNKGRLGNGEVFQTILGESSDRFDAEIAATAADKDYFVTNDTKLSRRARRVFPVNKVLDFSHFKSVIGYPPELL